MPHSPFRKIPHNPWRLLWRNHARQPSGSLPNGKPAQFLCNPPGCLLTQYAARHSLKSFLIFFHVVTEKTQAVMQAILFHPPKKSFLVRSLQ
jgi:hypothetical protein